MGGSGSTRWLTHSRKWRVEECLTLPIGLLIRDRTILPGVMATGGLKWTWTSGKSSSSVSYTVNTLVPGDERLCLQYRRTRTGEDIEQRIDLTTTPLPWGGLKWWFLCPRCWSGLGSLRRRKLYLPPGATHVGCRQCYDLTYESSQEAHRFDAMYRSMAAEIGGDWKDIRDMLTED
jgi:LSD1 subclass zinc finger protein